jgi:hypothetical protein
MLKDCGMFSLAPPNAARSHLLLNFFTGSLWAAVPAEAEERGFSFGRPTALTNMALVTAFLAIIEDQAAGSSLAAAWRCVLSESCPLLFQISDAYVAGAVGPG